MPCLLCGAPRLGAGIALDWTAEARRLLAARRPAFSLPQGFYLDEAMDQADLAAVFDTEWISAANACEIPQPGDHIAFEIGRASTLPVHDEQMQVRGRLRPMDRL